MRTRYLLAAALTAALTITFSAGEASPLPAEFDLQASKIIIDLRGGQVDVAIDPGATSTLRVEDANHGEDSEGFVLLDRADGTLRLAQPHGSDDLAPPLSVELRLGGGESVLFNGERLVVTLTDEREVLGEKERDLLREESGMEAARARRPGGVASRFHFRVEDSSVMLLRVPGARIEGTGNRVSARECRGPLLIDTESSTVEIDDHWGSLDLKGTNSDFAISGGDLRAGLHLDGGGATFASGGGGIQADARGALITVDQWAGSLQLQGSESRIEGTLSATEEDAFVISGEDQDIRISQHGGSLNLDLTGGRVELDGVAGRVHLQAREGTEIEASELDDVADIDLEDGATLQARDLVKGLSGKVRGAELRVAGLGEVDLKLSDAVASIAEVSGRVRLQITETQLDLDLSAPRTRPELKVAGHSQARVALASPCWVRLAKGAKEGASDRIQATGCEVLDKVSGRRPPVSLRGGRAPITLLADIDETSDLEVWSR